MDASLPKTDDEIRAWHTRLLALRDRLRDLGYDVRRVNGDAFDVGAQGNWHYLSAQEAQALADAPLDHPADLRQYGESRGLNFWYTFPAAADKSMGATDTG